MKRRDASGSRTEGQQRRRDQSCHGRKRLLKILKRTEEGCFETFKNDLLLSFQPSFHSVRFALIHLMQLVISFVGFNMVLHERRDFKISGSVAS